MRLSREDYGLDASFDMKDWRFRVEGLEVVSARVTCCKLEYGDLMIKIPPKLLFLSLTRLSETPNPQFPRPLKPQP